MDDYDEKFAMAMALLEPHRKVATCERAGGKSVEDMVNMRAAASLMAHLMYGQELVNAEAE